jgi:glycosyltransferase involved in cell wall biosynthesis
MVYLEAVAYRLPLVNTSVGAMNNIINHGKNGLITPAGNKNK